MAKKSKKLQELQNLFDESDVDFSLVSDKRITKYLQKQVKKIPDYRN